MRLKRSSDFKRVYHRGKVVEGAAFSFRILPSACGPRIGIVTPRQWGNAVERNRMKRHLREAFRRNRGCFMGIDLIVQPKKTSKRLSAAEVEQAFLGIIELCRDVEGNNE